jgi:hypothetical protein
VLRGVPLGKDATLPAGGIGAEGVPGAAFRLDPHVTAANGISVILLYLSLRREAGWKCRLGRVVDAVQLGGRLLPFLTVGCEEEVVALGAVGEVDAEGALGGVDVGDGEGAGPVCLKVGSVAGDRGGKDDHLVSHCEWKSSNAVRGVVGVMLGNDGWESVGQE